MIHSVGNYKSEIQNQNIEVPMPQIEGEDEQELLE